MSTRPIGPGTCNLSVNVRQSLRLTLGRMAFRCGVSMGALVRRVLAMAPALSRIAAKAAAADRDAAQLLRTAAADGITEADTPAILHAIDLIESSMNDDRQMCLVFEPKRAA